MSRHVSAQGPGERRWWAPDDASAVTGTTAARWAFGGLIVFTATLLLAPQESYPALRPLHLPLLSASMALIMAVSYHWKRQMPLLRWRELWFAFGLGTWAIVTTPFSYWPGGSVAELTGMFAKSLAVFWLIAVVLDQRRKMQWFLWTLAIASVPLAITALRRYASGEMAASVEEIKSVVGYSGGLTANPNDLALLLNLLLPFSLGLLLAERRASLRALLAAIIALNAAAIVVTFSRGAFLTLTLIIFIYLWRLFSRGAAALGFAIAAGGFVLWLMMPETFQEHLGTTVNIEADETGSAQARFRDMLAALHVIWSHPIFGAGLGQHVIPLNDVRGETWTFVHNVYLQYASDLGLPGVTLFAALVLGCWRRARQAMQSAVRSGDEWLSRVAEAASVSILAFAFAAMFHPVAYHFYFFYVGGTAVALVQLTGESHASPSEADGMVAHSVLGRSVARRNVG